MTTRKVHDENFRKLQMEKKSKNWLARVRGSDSADGRRRKAKKRMREEQEIKKKKKSFASQGNVITVRRPYQGPSQDLARFFF